MMLASHLWGAAGTALFLGISWFPGYEMALFCVQD